MSRKFGSKSNAGAGARKAKHSSKSSQSGASKARKAKQKAKTLAEFKAAYIGAKPAAERPENLTRNPSANDGRRR